MRHAIKRHQLNRPNSWRKATLNSMARNLLIYQSIRTTLAKAKASRPLAEKLISLAKQNTLAARRQAAQILNDHKLVSLLFKEVAPRFEKRQSGFTRIIGLGKRRGDSAEMVIFELTEIKKKEPKRPKKEKASLPKEAAEGEAKEKEVEKKTSVALETKERPELQKKPAKKFLGGIKNIFKKKSDSL